ncbi:MAG TPA: hypothetical protein VI387_11090, partial [Candidatus Brocadiales bacterium]|nr:hypothetical protein [Candidatus Brocadiales bacterium]
IPGSKENNKLFGHIFDIGIDGSFNPNLKADAIIYVDSIEVLKGVMQLLKINILEENKIEYEITIIGKLADIFTNMSDAELADLDFSDLDHTYNRSTQKASWTATVGEGYVYPMIDYGYSNGQNFDVEHFFPAVYLKEYIDRIFEYAGFSYQSNFFTSDFFKRLIVPFNSDKFKLSSAQIDARKFKAEVNPITSGSITLPSGVHEDKIPYNNELSDPSGLYNNSTYIFTAAANGDYTFSVFNEVRVFGVTTCTNTTPGIRVDIYKEIPGGQTFFLNSNLVYPAGFGSGGTTITAGSFSPYVTCNVNVPLVNLKAGDKVYAKIKVFNFSWPGFTAAGTLGFQIKENSLFLNDVINSGFKDGDTALMNNAIPADVKMADLFKSVIKAFNLYVETDKDV